MMSDDNPRPQKRQRLAPASLLAAPDASPCLAPLPPAVLLVSLPSLLAHPPNHRAYIPSICLSLVALRRCIALGSLPPELECRAWTGLAELGIKVVGGGLSQSEDHPWARGMEVEVEKAISKGFIIAQKHPSLRAYKHQLALLQAQLSHWQHKTKFARTQIRNLVASFLPTDPPHIIYTAHLAAITLLTSPVPPPSKSAQEPAPHRPHDITAVLSAAQDLEALAEKNGHGHVVLLARVVRLRILVAADMWADVPAALQPAETALGLSYEPASTPKPRKPEQGSQSSHGSTPQRDANFVAFEDPFEAAMVLHLLVMAVVHYTHAGSAAEASPRLSHLHALLDSGALDKFPNGSVEIALPNSAPLVVETTHPRVLFLLAFLVSSAAKRDAVGRKPKRKVFAAEGLATWEKEYTREIMFSPWAGLGDVEEVEQRVARIKADLLCELIAVSIMRSEFDAAEQNLSSLVAHTRTYALFPRFAARIALHHAHLAHALGQTSRALDCYRAAAHHAEPGSFVDMAARAGEIVLRIGLARGLPPAEDQPESNANAALAFEDGMRLAKACRGMGGTLEAVGQVIEACLTPEILKAKQHLKQALALATKAQDNYLRALVLALIASHYFHTASDHALEMLQTCEQLAAGLGAPPTKSASGEKAAIPAVVGNAPLGLWVGERFMELFKRAGKESRVQKQAALNAELVKAVEALAARGTDTGALQT